MNQPNPPETAAPAPPTTPMAADWKRALYRPAVLAVAAALALLTWQWLETRERLADVQQELAKRLAESDAVAKESRVIARQNQETIAAVQARLSLLDAQLSEAQGQQLALESMYQELSRSRDERLLSEVEQSVSIAAQQLQLAGNVQAALIALQGADARLARAAQPQLLGVRKLIARDMERLKAMPTADVPGMALKLESIVSVADTLPLAYEQRPQVAPTVPASSSPMQASFWQALAGDLWAEARQLIRIERIGGGADPALLAPSQTFFLRENLKLRLIDARLALLARDGRSFREDVRQAAAWLERYFDGRAKPVQGAIATLKGLAGADVGVEAPSLNETLDALRNFKLAKSGK